MKHLQQEFHKKKDNCNFNLTKDNELDINSTCLTISSLCNSGYH